MVFPCNNRLTAKTQRALRAAAVLGVLHVFAVKMVLRIG